MNTFWNIKYYGHNSFCFRKYIFNPRLIAAIQGLYLSLIGESIRTDDAFVVLNRGFWITGFIFVPEVYVVEAKPLRVALIPLKLVEQ